MQKRGSLSLSIDAIVIIVLAMTLLGLGLGFIRGLFRDVTDTTSTVQEQVKQQILEDLKTGDKKLSFSTNTLNVGHNAREVISVGVKNSKRFGNLKFALLVETIQKKTTNQKVSCSVIGPWSETTDVRASTCTCSDVASDGTTTACATPVDFKILSKDIDFFYNKGPFTLQLDDAEVYPITVTASGDKGLYLVKISILEDIDSDSNYGDPAKDEIYAEKTFFVNVA